MSNLAAHQGDSISNESLTSWTLLRVFKGIALVKKKILLKNRWDKASEESLNVTHKFFRPFPPLFSPSFFSSGVNGFSLNVNPAPCVLLLIYRAIECTTFCPSSSLGWADCWVEKLNGSFSQLRWVNNWPSAPHCGESLDGCGEYSAFSLNKTLEEATLNTIVIIVIFCKEGFLFESMWVRRCNTQALCVEGIYLAFGNRFTPSCRCQINTLLVGGWKKLKWPVTHTWFQKTGEFSGQRPR